MAFNNWPYTNFADLNLNWLLNKMKEAVATAAAALAKSNAIEEEVGTYSERIENANTTAQSAYNRADTAIANAANAQSDATSGIAIGRAAQNTANAALSAANNAQDSADTAIDSAATAERNAAAAVQAAEIADANSQNALNDYLDVHISAYTDSSVQSDKNVDQILAAVLANKKIRFTLDDTRNGETYVTYDYIINPVENTSSDIDIQIYFDTSVSSSSLKYFLATLTKRVGAGDTVTYATIGGDVTFSGGGGGSADAVLYTVQNLTTAQRTQARNNIDAAAKYYSFTNAMASTFTLLPNTFVEFTGVINGSLTLAFANETNGVLNEYHCRFTTGSNQNTMLNLPSGVVVPVGFYAYDPNYLLPNTVYEISIINNYLTYCMWEA